MKISAKPYRILSLDGGGTWALIQSKVLMDMYGADTEGEKILANFDLVAANSSGGIVAAGLIANLSPAKILQLFLDAHYRKSLFQELPLYKRLLRVIGMGPQFSTVGKLHGLSQVLGGKASDALAGLSIPNRHGKDLRFLFMGYDYDRDRGTIFRSDSNSPAANFPRSVPAVSVIDAVNASSTAPVQYFDEPAAVGSKRYWDGAVAGLNNPILVAVVEAIAYGVATEDIGVLSIGTGNVFLPLIGPLDRPELVKARQSPGVFNDIKKLASAILADPPDRDTFVAHMVLNGSVPAGQEECPVGEVSIARMNPLIRPTIQNGTWNFPGGCTPDGFKRLVEMDMAVTDQRDVLRINDFCNGWMKDIWPNQPIRHGGDANAPAPNPTFCEIGHPTYTAAKRAW
ncbi:MAG: patatin [Gallionella sp.]|jgi:hypothetical protein|nr:patatin [Gallionella sp.]